VLGCTPKLHLLQPPLQELPIGAEPLHRQRNPAKQATLHLPTTRLQGFGRLFQGLNQRGLAWHEGCRGPPASPLLKARQHQHCTKKAIKLVAKSEGHSAVRDLEVQMEENWVVHPAVQMVVLQTVTVGVPMGPIAPAQELQDVQA